MSRGSSGRVAAVAAALTALSPGLAVTAGNEGVALGLGETAGKSSAGSVGVLPASGADGSVPGRRADVGGRATGAGPVALPVGRVLRLGDSAARRATTTIADERTDADPAALALPISCTSSPWGAPSLTLTLACSSSVCPTGTSPSLQVAPLADGHTLNFGEPMPATGWTLIVADTALAVAPVLQTKIV